MADPSDKAEGKPIPPQDVAAWAIEYGPALRRYFQRRADPADVDDLVQEVFLNLQARAGGEALGNVHGYLFTIAKHVLIARHRGAGARKPVPWEVVKDHSAVADELSPERILAAKQEYARAIVAILSLPPRTRTAFELHRFDKLSYSAIAAQMGISKRSVQDLMERAIVRLSQAMRKGS